MVREGYRRTRLGIIPANWEIISIENDFAFLPNNTLSWDCMNSVSGIVQNIHYGDVLTKYGSILDCENDDIPFIDSNIPINTVGRTVQSGDVVIADTAEDATVGKAVEVTNVANRKVLSGLHTIVLRPRPGLFAEKYLGYFMNSTVYQNQLLPHVVGTKVSSISKRGICDTIILRPPLREQHNIVEVLSDVDGLIFALEKVIEKKKAIRKGVIQDLVTGKRHLPEFRGRWVEKTLGEFNIRKGSVIKQDQIKPGNIPVVAGGKKAAYYHNKHNREANTITVSASGSNAGFVNFWDCKIFASGCSTIEESENFDVRFVYYWLVNSQKAIYELQTGGAQPHILPSDLAPIVIRLPEKEEQTAIADILSDMDKEIDMLKLKLSKAKHIKFGMMSDLLTGRVRMASTSDIWRKS